MREYLQWFGRRRFFPLRNARETNNQFMNKKFMFQPIVSRVAKRAPLCLSRPA
jgi:hypothetical protein